MRTVFFTSEFEFGEKSLVSLLNQQENIIAVVIPPLKPENHRAAMLKKTALEHNIPVYEWKNIKTPEALEQLKNWQADLAISAGNKRYVFTRQVLDCFRLGAVNYHSSLLPKNGGQFPINWQIYKGEPEIGITIHYCDEGIDTGDLILQEAVPLGPDDTFKSIYFGCVLQKSVDLLSQAVRLIREGKAPRIVQDLSQSTYNNPFSIKEATIDWSQPTQQIYNTIRASDAWPGAQTTFRGETLKIWQAKKVNSTYPSEQPGTIVDVSDKGVIVATIDGGILIERLQLGDGKKMMAKEFLAADSIKLGEKIG
ncbi:methionyl-tRNA formyltransferase [Paradesulfitobacterium aromaticivorans]